MNLVQGRYTLGANVGTPEWDAEMEARAKAQMEARAKVMKDITFPTAAKVGIGIGGLLIAGLAIWFFFFRK